MSRDATIDSPYRGLTYYREEDARYFFGRERERQVIATNLMASRLTIVYGESGVGKSSLLRAGVVHRLGERARKRFAEQGRVDGLRSPEFVPVVFSSWRDDPVAGLRVALGDAVAPYLDGRELELDPEATLDELLAVASEAANATLLLILDQFEEYFMYHGAGADGDFARDFPKAVMGKDVRANFLIGIREDAYARLDFFKGRVPILFDNYLRIPHLSRDAARAAIEKPIEEYNRELLPGMEAVTVEPALVDAVLDQVRAGAVVLLSGGEGDVEGGRSGDDDTIETPYLQLVITRLWEEEMERGSRALRLSTLEELGGAEHIVRRHVDTSLAALTPAERAAAAVVFRQLVTRGGTKVAHTVSDLADFAELPEDELAPLLQKLADEPARILRPVGGGPDEGDRLRYEIFHDVLAPSILDWRTRHALADKDAEARREGRRARKFRAVAIVAIVLFLLASALALFAWDQQRAARSKRLAAEAIAMLAIDPAASVGIASNALDVKSTDEAEDALRRSLSESRLRLVVDGHDDWVTHAAFDRSGRLVVTSSEDETARVWNARTGRSRAGFRHPDVVNWAAISSDGRHVVTGANDDKARIWDVRTGDVVAELDHGGDVLSTVFGRDGSTVLTAGADGTARLWRWRDGAASVVARGKPVGGGARAEVARAVLAEEGSTSFVATASEDVVRIWERNGRSAPCVEGQGRVMSVAVDSQARYVVAGLETGTALIFEVTLQRGRRGCEFVSLLGGHGGPVTDAAFDPDGTLVATASEDGTVRVWEPALERAVSELRGHADVVTSVAFRHDGREILTAGGDATARIWSWRRDRDVELRGHGAPVNSADFSADGQYLVTAGHSERAGEGQIAPARIWDAAGRELRVLTRPRWGAVNDAAFHPETDSVAIAASDGTVSIWSASTGKWLGGRRIHRTSVTSATFSPDGSLLATTAADGTAALWEWPKEKPKIWKPHGDWAYSAEFSADGAYLATTGHDEKAFVWELGRGAPERVSELTHPGPVWKAAYDPTDPSRLVTGSGDGVVRMWDWESRRVVFTMEGHTQAVMSVAFSRDGERVLTTGADRETRLWDADDGRILAVLRRHADAVTSGEFSRDGSLVLTASRDRTAKAYLCETCLPLERLRELAEPWERYAEARVRG